MAEQQAYHYVLIGKVQGVGFRPYIYRLATQHQLTGWVKNQLGQVEILVQGDAIALQHFHNQLIPQAPPLAQPIVLSYAPCSSEFCTQFTILDSEDCSDAQIHVPPDYFTCNDCLAELQNPQDRRYHYPFINCTQCGPRYTLIKQLPYDRSNTSMADFPLCDNCLAEYTHPNDRRFHAQPLACPVCGPQLTFYDKKQIITDTQHALQHAIQALRHGQIIAVKGIGGYHLLCAADNDQAIQRLRNKKPRPTKPLAVMLTDLNLEKDEITTKLLHDPSRPIVLIDKKCLPQLSSQIAPNLNEIGIMLPYSPLHHLLLTELGKPVVATSANRSGEPVFTDNQQVEQALSHVADGFLHHNRPIIRPADDSVFRKIANHYRPLRLGRGHAPIELNLPFSVSQPTLAVGAFLKNTVALAWQNRVVISPHIGDLGTVRSLDVFTQVIEDLQQLYRVRAVQLVCDAHSHYSNTRWAKTTGLPVKVVYHHHAHASAIVGEFSNLSDNWLVFTWDGTGLGNDGQLWGGDVLYGYPSHWQRVAHLRPFRLPGGDKAGRELWRSALGICWEIGIDYPINQEISLLKRAWQQQLNSPFTTSVGRLFDAMVALSGLSSVAHFEGEGAMQFEQLCIDSSEKIDLPCKQNSAHLWEIDWSPLVEFMFNAQVTIAEKSTIFHNTLAASALKVVLKLAVEKSIDQIGLTGGVFQNRYLTEKMIHLLTENGFQVFLPRQLPCNDAAISFGQIVESGY